MRWTVCTVFDMGRKTADSRFLFIGRFHPAIGHEGP